jgi:transposase-like protein
MPLNCADSADDHFRGDPCPSGVRAGGGVGATQRRSTDQHGQVIDVLLSQRRDLAAARRFFTSALRAGTIPAEVTTDRAAAYPRVLDELIPSALHTVEQYTNNPVETDHGAG